MLKKEVWPKNSPAFARRRASAFQSFGLLPSYGAGDRKRGSLVNNGEHVRWFGGLDTTVATKTWDGEA